MELLPIVPESLFRLKFATTTRPGIPIPGIVAITDTPEVAGTKTILRRRLVALAETTEALATDAVLFFLVAAIAETVEIETMFPARDNRREALTDAADTPSTALER